MSTQQRLILQAEGQINAQGGFEVLAISAGQGNGWHFPASVLKESLPLWEGVACYVDHHDLSGERSVRDLAGVFTQPRWEEHLGGIKLNLYTLGPAGSLVAALGRQLIAVNGAKPRVGFSADIIFAAEKPALWIAGLIECATGEAITPKSSVSLSIEW